MYNALCNVILQCCQLGDRKGIRHANFSNYICKSFVLTSGHICSSPVTVKKAETTKCVIS